MEVLEELQSRYGFTPRALAEIKAKKLQAKGGFTQGFVMKLTSP
jgi:predicted house-cleaning noncanonical NTP pyrophosphatase (MazG superfamily)